jgi:RNA-binding protein PNO1
MTTRAASKKATAAPGRATNPTPLPVVVAAVNEEEAEQHKKVDNDAMEMEFYNRIIHDPSSSVASPLTSRLVQSKSIQREDAAMNDDDTDEENGGTTTIKNGEEEVEDQQAQQPMFAKLSAHAASSQQQRHTTAGKQISKAEYRRVRCPAHRYTPLRECWEQLLTPLVEYLKLQVRFNTRTRSVEIKTSKHTLETSSLQKGADFIGAFMLGFEPQDAVALLRLDDLYVESFQVTDVKTLRGDHLSRAIGRVAGQDGKTRFAIENATRTRIVIADSRVHMLGSYGNIRLARNAICDLILGAPPGKVYNNMRNVAKRMNERY